MLSHYSKEANKTFSTDHPIPLDNDHKPGGLWLSDDAGYGWYAFVLDRLRSGSSDWADGEELLQYRYDFTIDPSQSDRVLLLESPDDLRRFTWRYREAASRKCVVDDKLGYGLHIEWGRVKADYMGILVTPFHPALSRKDPFYHWYRFDCASGCFWDIACLTQATTGTRTSLTAPWSAPGRA